MTVAAPVPWISRSNDRRLPADYRGDVLVWDIDKTYLDTHFSSLRGLAAIPFDMAIDKEAIPGSIPLLRALRRGTGPKSALVPLYFISGSPLQLRGTIERKMTIDGVEFDGITFKDQLGLLKKGRIRAIKAQVGYKLLALLLYRAELPANVTWYLFGDDVESDAETFDLFRSVLEGLRGSELGRALTERKVDPQDHPAIIAAAAGLPIDRAPIGRAFIHLTRRADPERFSRPHEVAVHSFLQAALVLAGLGKISDAAIAAVAADLRARFVPGARITADLEDAHGRLGVPEEKLSWARRAIADE